MIFASASDELPVMLIVRFGTYPLLALTFPIGTARTTISIAKTSATQDSSAVIGLLMILRLLI